VFSTSPISFVSRGKAKQKAKERDEDVAMDADESGVQGAVNLPERYTAIGVSKGEGVDKKSEGKVLWCWRGEDGSEKDKVTVSTMLACRTSLKGDIPNRR
jgi:hypothetical protein